MLDKPLWGAAPAHGCVVKKFKKGGGIMKVLLKFWSKINFIYFYEIIGFGIFAIPGYYNTIIEDGVFIVIKSILLFSMYTLVLGFIIEYYKQNTFGIRIRFGLKTILYKCIGSAIGWGYLLYFKYCSNIYVYMIPVFGTLLLILIEKVKLKRLREGKE